MDKRLNRILQNAMYTAIYVALCYVFQPISYGMIQVRIAEALCIMALFDDFAILSITLGCLLSNLFIFNSIIDAIFGTVATFIGLICIKFIKKNNFFLKMLPTILSNAIIIPFVLKFAYFENTPLLLSGVWVGLGEVVAVYVIGYILYHALQRTRLFEKLA